MAHPRPEYRAWWNARDRCDNWTDLRYGGRGISMCDEWRNSFEAFLSHIGERPAPGRVLDRINNDGDYEPGNVRWVTYKESAGNRRHPPSVDTGRKVREYISICGLSVPLALLDKYHPLGKNVRYRLRTGMVGAEVLYPRTLRYRKGKKQRKKKIPVS